jgi:hypothetical protein
MASVSVIDQKIIARAKTGMLTIAKQYPQQWSNPCKHTPTAICHLRHYSGITQCLHQPLSLIENLKILWSEWECKHSTPLSEFHLMLGTSWAPAQQCVLDVAWCSQSMDSVHILHRTVAANLVLTIRWHHLTVSAVYSFTPSFSQDFHSSVPSRCKQWSPSTSIARISPQLRPCSTAWLLRYLNDWSCPLGVELLCRNSLGCMEHSYHGHGLLCRVQPHSLVWRRLSPSRRRRECTLWWSSLGS